MVTSILARPGVSVPRTHTSSRLRIRATVDTGPRGLGFEVVVRNLGSGVVVGVQYFDTEIAADAYACEVVRS